VFNPASEFGMMPLRPVLSVREGVLPSRNLTVPFDRIIELQSLTSLVRQIRAFSISNVSSLCEGVFATIHCKFTYNVIFCGRTRDGGGGRQC
jgi:hypothetical protein